MNHYLAEFLTLGLDKHFDILFNISFGGFKDFSISLLLIVLLIFMVMMFIVFPYVLGRFVEEKENKIKNKIWVVVIDIVLIAVFAIFGAGVFNLYSGLRQGLSAEGAFYGSVARGLVNYRENIGLICGCIYSILINNRLLNKYLGKLRIDKYKKPIFIALFIVFLFVLYYFYYLCRFA